MPTSQHSYTFDTDMELADGAANTTSSELGQVDSADKVIDLGSTAGAAFTPASLVVDVSAIDFTTGDETYDIMFLLSAVVAMTGAVAKACIPMGDARDNFADDTAAGRVVLGVDNEHKGTIYRFAALYVSVTGTTPIINVKAFLSR